MKRRVTIILSAILIVYGTVGCQRTHDTPPRSQDESPMSKSSKNNDDVSEMADTITSSWSSVFQVDVSEMADIVTSMCDTLGATVEQTSEEAQHIKWHCKFPSSASLEVDATPFVKGKTFVRFCIRGDVNMVSLLQREVQGAASNALSTHKHD
ncbi:MAG: hypothetical protein K9N55_03445 [Phycisphaerae bacterium]|nr:hypothetical protein [Phycisphaerae bacterium]